MSDLTIGSPEWIEHVRTTPPVRDPRGRSRPTQRWNPHLEALERESGLEGGNELTCALLLEILHAAGLVTWFKEQPFKLNPESHGVDATPDFMFQWKNGALYVPEVKSARFVTSEVEAECAAISAVLAKGNLNYLLWTDKKHLTKRVWHNVRQVRMRSNRMLPAGQIERVAALMRDGPMTLEQLIAAGIDSDVVLHEVYRGKLHFDLTEKRHAKTLITRSPDAAAYSNLLGSRPDPESWWNALQDR